MTNINLPSGAKPVENPNSFAHQSIGNASQSAPNAWTAMPSQGNGPAHGYNQSIPTNGMGAPIPMAVSPQLGQMAAAPDAQMAPAGVQMQQQQPAPYQQPAPAMNAMQPLAQNNEAAALHTFDPVEFESSEDAPHPAPAPSAPISFVSQVLTLPSTYDGVWDFAKKMATCDFCPPQVRSPENVFYLFARAASLGLPWTAAFTDFFVIPAGKGAPRIGMYVHAKEALCRKHGVWSVKCDKATGIATAVGMRYSDGARDQVVFDGWDAALRGRLGHDDQGNIIGLGTWADKWPDMLMIRAVGRLLDRLFADIIGGVASVEELNDMMFEAELRKDAAAIAEEKAESKTTTALKKIRSKKAKAIEAKPAEPAPAALEAAPAAPQSSAQPAAQPQPAEASASPYGQMKQGAPASDAAVSLNDLVSETNFL